MKLIIIFNFCLVVRLKCVVESLNEYSVAKLSSILNLSSIYVELVIHSQFSIELSLSEYIINSALYHMDRQHCRIPHTSKLSYKKAHWKSSYLHTRGSYGSLKSLTVLIRVPRNPFVCQVSGTPILILSFQLGLAWTPPE